MTGPVLIPLALAAALAAAPALAQEGGRPVEVDVELALMVDVSRSMSPAELEIQRRGYAEALTSDEVIAAIAAGLLGRVAVTYVEWAGEHAQRTIVDWRLLETREDAEAFATTLTAEFTTSMRRTSISGAIAEGHRLIEGNAFSGLRRVIDVSGDGPNNSGPPVTEARDRALAAGMIINGLPLMTDDGMGGQWDIEDLDEYYINCVIGGPGAFVVPVLHWEAFAEAVRRKLVLELVGLPPQRPTPRALPSARIVPIQFVRPAPYDCLIGEKIWDRTRRYFEMP